MKLKIEVVHGNKLTINHSYILLVYLETIDNNIIEAMLRTITTTGDKSSCGSISRKEYWST